MRIIGGDQTYRTWLLALGGLVLPSLSYAQSSENLAVAEYTSADELVLPADIDTWIALGSNIGGDYADGEFDAENPGAIGVVQMEPSAYRFFVENGRYANGTMLLLSFFQTQQKPQPALRGFVQGDLSAREMHVIDRDKYVGERAFYMFPVGLESSPRLVADAECVECHGKHGALDSTFIQFYPAIRDLVADREE